MNSNERTVVLALGSTNELKGCARSAAAERVRKAPARDMGLVRFVLPAYDVRSGVHEQPMGFSAMSLGAITRAERALKAAKQDPATPSGAYLLGIAAENGLECMAGRWVDVAVVAVVREALLSTNATSLVGLSISVGIPFPDEYVAMALQDEQGLSRHTAGSKVAMVLGGSSGDPHATLTGGRVTRLGLLIDAFYAALVQVPGL